MCAKLELHMESIPSEPINQNQTTEQAEAGRRDVLGIISIIIAFSIFQIIGIILAIIGIFKSRQQGRPSTLSIIGLVLNSIMLVSLAIAALVYISIHSYNNVVERARQVDVEKRRTAQIMVSIAADEKKLKGKYPQSCSELISLPAASANELFASNKTDNKEVCGDTQPTQNNDNFMYKVLPTGEVVVSYWSSEKQTVETISSK